MSDTNDPNVSEPGGIPPVPPAAQYAQPQPPLGAAQPQGTPPQYPAAPTYQGGNVAPTNGMAIAALITGILVPIVGIILGHISLGQIKRTGENGRGLALAGLICGYVFTAIGLLYIIFIIVLISAGAMSGGYNY